MAKQRIQLNIRLNQKTMDRIKKYAAQLDTQRKGTLSDTPIAVAARELIIYALDELHIHADETA